MDIVLKENERIDDLEYKGLKIIQNSKGFCFGIDGVLLANFAKNLRGNSDVIDLGTGTAIMPILLSEKSKAKKIVGVEIQSDVADMAQRSVKLNNLENKIKIINENILNLKNIYQKNSFDAIITNPPYKKINTGIINNDDKKLISRHEITASLEDFIDISAYLLKDLGELYMIHRPERLVDILYDLRVKKLEPKNIRFIFSNEKKEPKLVLIKAVKNGKSFLKVDRNLYVYDNDGNYTNEILEIYEKEKNN